MRGDILKGAVVGAVSAVLVVSAATALAGTGVGKIFNLGKANSVNKTSYLSGSTSGRMLWVTNNGSGPALGLSVKPGHPPFTVNSTVKVSGLNADSLDGIDSSCFINGTASSTQKVNNSGPGAALSLQVQPGQPPFEVNSAEKVANLNADSLDGIDSADLMQGAGSVVHARMTQSLGDGNGVMLTVPQHGTVEVSTGFGGVPNYRLFWRNGLSGTTADVWYTNGATTTYASVAPDAGVYFAPLDGDADAIYTIRSGYPGHTATIIVSAHADLSGGVYYAQATTQ